MVEEYFTTDGDILWKSNMMSDYDPTIPNSGFKTITACTDETIEIWFDVSAISNVGFLEKVELWEIDPSGSVAAKVVASVDAMSLNPTLAP